MNLKDLTKGTNQSLVLGRRGTGKTNFCKYLINEYSDGAAIFDPMHEYSDRNKDVVFRPSARRGEDAIKQLNWFIEEIVKDNKDSIDTVVIDEVNRYHKKMGLLEGELGDLVDLGRHYGLSVIYVARQPSQLHTSLRGLADNIIIFSLRGTADMRWLEDYWTGLSDHVQELNKYESIWVNGELTKLQNIPLVRD